MKETACQKEYIRRIHKVQDYMEAHIGEALTIEELAKIAGFSKYHFSRIFQGILGEPLAHYVSRVRLEQALFYLAHRRDMNMTDIALELGFTDSAVFSRAFKHFHGISPSEYRKAYSKNCKEPFLLSEYNKEAAKEERAKKRGFPVKGEITLETLPDQEIVYVRHVGSYESLAENYERLLNELIESAQKEQLFASEESWILAMYHDNPEFGEEESFRTTIGMTVPKGQAVNESSSLGRMPLKGGRYAVGRFYITAEEFGDAWNYMYDQWLTQSGYVPCNSYPFEVYLNDPRSDAEHKIDVAIYVPIEPLSF